jgi:NADH-quinone oxidoreductase subunit A
MAVYKDWVTRGVGGVALLEIVTFVAILAVGLVYVWAKGDLAWLRRLTDDRRGRERGLREAA